jgi:hypothetical protein
MIYDRSEFAAMPGRGMLNEVHKRRKMNAQFVLTTVKDNNFIFYFASIPFGLRLDEERKYFGFKNNETRMEYQMSHRQVVVVVSTRIWLFQFDL